MWIDALRVQCLLSNYDGLSLNPHHPHKTLGVAPMCFNPSMGMGGGVEQTVCTMVNLAEINEYGELHTS